MTYLFVLSPTEPNRTYDFVAANMDVICRLAVELNGFQAAARAAGKRLNVIVRYASEMNDAGEHGYKGHPDAFVASFVAVRRAFAEHAPRVLFSFSPALRADLRIREIAEYWPGDEYVDIVGATWYVHGEKQRVAGMQHVRDYFLTSLARGKPFAVDEFGGALGESDEGIYRNNDVMLEAMLHELEALALQNVTFTYGTIFLDDGKYGVDATLRFLAPRA
jgi:beta-mannanase